MKDAGLKQVLGLRPRAFYYLPGYGDEGAKRQYGLVAEEVNEVLPQLVGRDTTGKIANLDYGALWPITVRALQELNTEVETLKQQILSQINRR